MDGVEQLGPLEILVFGIDEPSFDGSIATELARLDKAGVIRILDAAMVVREDEETIGTVDVESELIPGRPLLGSIVGALIGYGAGGEDGALAGAAYGAAAGVDPVHSDDLLELAQELPVGGMAAVVIWENRWALRLRRALSASDAYVIVNELVTAEDLVAYGADLSGDDATSGATP
jgi:hypothetical protein